MDDDSFNMSLRRFLKTVGVTSQREIEQAVRAALTDGRLKGGETLEARVSLRIGEVGLDHEIVGRIALD